MSSPVTSAASGTEAAVRARDRSSASRSTLGPHLEHHRPRVAHLLVEADVREEQRAALRRGPRRSGTGHARRSRGRRRRDPMTMGPPSSGARSPLLRSTSGGPHPFRTCSHVEVACVGHRSRRSTGWATAAARPPRTPRGRSHRPAHGARPARSIVSGRGEEGARIDGRRAGFERVVVRRCVGEPRIGEGRDVPSLPDRSLHASKSSYPTPFQVPGARWAPVDRVVEVVVDHVPDVLAVRVLDEDVLRAGDDHVVRDEVVPRVELHEQLDPVGVHDRVVDDDAVLGAAAAPVVPADRDPDRRRVVARGCCGR